MAETPWVGREGEFALEGTRFSSAGGTECGVGRQGWLCGRVNALVPRARAL